MTFQFTLASLFVILSLQACLPPPERGANGVRKSDNVAAAKSESPKGEKGNPAQTGVSNGSATAGTSAPGAVTTAPANSLPPVTEIEIIQNQTPEIPPVLEADSPTLDKAAYLRYPLAENRNLAYVSNRDITKAAQSIDTVIIIVHGLDRNPMVYYNSLQAAVKAQGVSEKTWVIAPFFMQAEDKPLANDLTWEDGNWKEGISAKGLSGAAWSSYAALDTVVKALDKPLRFSKLKKIYLVGFSAGGQFMQRYTVGTKISDDMKRLNFRFVIGSPGSYMYLTPERLKAGSKTVFDRSAVSSCSGYDDFRYGINKRPEYLMQSTQADMLARLKYRDIRWISGEADTSRGGVLDVECGADLQGANRFARSQAYFAYVKSLAADHHSKVFSVPGAGHDHDRVFPSAQGRAAIFND
ncbi:MAG: hypothetical protein EOP07_02230 [Proteobacteria bacterium]|nr:MAG: hypothetical protein EOP07_02230 [Pseudomonadota bacterium]